MGIGGVPIVNSIEGYGIIRGLSEDQIHPLTGSGELGGEGDEGGRVSPSWGDWDEGTGRSHTLRLRSGTSSDPPHAVWCTVWGSPNRVVQSYSAGLLGSDPLTGVNWKKWERPSPCISTGTGSIRR